MIRPRVDRATVWAVAALICAASSASAAPHKPKPKVAVMTLEDQSGTLSASFRRGLTEYLRTRLNATKKFVIIARSRQSEKLQELIEKQKKESYKACYDKSCQIPLGKALSADSVVRLQVSELAGSYVVSADRIDLAKEASVGGGYAECEVNPKRGRDKRLKEAMASVARQLAGAGARPPDRGGDGSPAPPPPPVDTEGPEIETGRVTKAVGSLTVSVKPYGKVRLDLTPPKGKSIASGSPYESRTAAPGTWKLLARGKGYEPKEHRFQVLADEPTLVKLELSKLGGLVVEGKPSGAKVSVKGPHGFAHEGGLPWRAKSGLRLGRYEVAVSRLGYEPWTGAADVGPAKVTRVPVALKRDRVAAPIATVSGGSTSQGDGGLTWVRLATGTFSMGSAEGQDDEKPVHTVRLDAFEMSKSEVTVGQYRACVKAGKCGEHHLTGYEWPGQEFTKDSRCNWPRGDRADHPLNCVDWSQATSFCRWAGGRLPTEAEWEYAARSGGKSRTYPWGNEKATCSRAVMDDGGAGCGKNRTWPVCSKTRGNTPQGLCDMAGNVWEWVSDWYSRDYYGSSPARAPRGPKSGSFRVRRGGSWFYPAGDLRAAYRLGNSPGARGPALGFRCVRSHP